MDGKTTKDLKKEKKEKAPRKMSKQEQRLKKLSEKAVTVNAADALKQNEEDMIKEKPFVSSMQTKFYEPNGLSKSKNQLSALAYDVQQHEKELAEKKAVNSAKMQKTRDKYGW
ncbi:hypothetical protein EIN_026850 [Entamoeba invadens IP1]|uniref:hypothetical protein n=1 Tax=Entamoeba invadens IP1 TaxID=370355 RepID=UPI0002C3D8E3|nr:hypothetical protein EIN_026850 [Entamoeba invadens IP1]ELP90806.1 hypothetical protein EIN_026850 [Entamoeba invadens IP1]|eukprot:XP_004257577.1 hypothetical protein EIN_026850 [Entamoeba invadens IP1]